MAGCVFSPLAIGGSRFRSPDLHTHYLDLVETAFRRAMEARGLPLSSNRLELAQTGGRARRPCRRRRAARDRSKGDGGSGHLIAMHAAALYRRLSEADCARAATCRSSVFCRRRADKI